MNSKGPKIICCLEYTKHYLIKCSIVFKYKVQFNNVIVEVRPAKRSLGSNFIIWLSQEKGTVAKEGDIFRLVTKQQPNLVTKVDIRGSMLVYVSRSINLQSSFPNAFHICCFPSALSSSSDVQCIKYIGRSGSEAIKICMSSLLLSP